jgi:hypothetical protein
MVGFVPAIHAFAAAQDVDARVPQTSLRSLRKLDCVPAHDVPRKSQNGDIRSRNATTSSPIS